MADIQWEDNCRCDILKFKILNIMKFIIQRNAETKEIVGAWHSQKECAEYMGVKPPAIAQAIKLNGKCKGYIFEKADVPSDVVLEVIKKTIQ